MYILFNIYLQVFVRSNDSALNENSKNVMEGHYNIDVDYIIFYPSYNEKTHHGDVALIRMSKPVHYFESYYLSGLTPTDIFNNLQKWNFRTVFRSFSFKNQAKEEFTFFTHYQKMYYLSEECLPRQNLK